MGKEPLSAELDRIGGRFESRISGILLDSPGAGTLPQPRGDVPVQEVVSVSRPARKPPKKLLPSITGTLSPASVRDVELPPEKPPARSLRRWGAAAVCLLVAAGLAGGRVREAISSRIHQSIPLQYSAPVGLSLRGRALMAADVQRGIFFTVDVGGLKVGPPRKHFNPALTGLSLEEEALWSTEARAGRIFQHEAKSDYTVRRVFSNPASRPSAIHWDGSFLWVSDLRTETISQYRVGATLSLQRQYALPGIVPAGLRAQGGTLWVCDSVSRKILSYKVGSLLTGEEALDLGPWLPAGARITGFAADDRDAWILTDAPAALHRLRLRPLALLKQAGLEWLVKAKD